MEKEKSGDCMDILSKPILLVDDEKDIAEVLRLSLQHFGFAVHAFTDPEEAIAKFKPGFYGLMIADIRMPKVSGFDLFHKLTERDPNLKTCFLSSFEIYEKEYKRIFPYSNIVCFIKKPIAPSELVQRIRKEVIIFNEARTP